MADKRISELTALAGASVADDDALAIVDTSATQTKKIVVSELKAALDTSTGFVRITGDTMTGDLTVPNLVTAGNVDGRDVSADGTKLDTIETGATADQSASEIKTAYESNSDTNAFTDADHSKLDGIEASADVTDTTNVTAAGALMDSELADVAAVKAINQSLTTTSTPTFGGMTTTGTVTADGLTVETSGANSEAYFDNGSKSYRLLNSSSDNAFSIFDNTASAFRLTTASNGDISFYEDTGTTAKFFWDASAENLGIGTSSPFAPLQITHANGRIGFNAGNTSGGTKIQAFTTANADGYLAFEGYTKEYMRIDSSGNLLVGATTTTNMSDGTGNDGIALNPAGTLVAARTSNVSMVLNRLSTDGAIANFAKNGTTVGSIGITAGDNMYFQGSSGHVGFESTGAGLVPWEGGSSRDNVYDLGTSAARWDDVYATNGTIQTSDINEKQDIELLSEAEQRVAVACKGLLRKFRWKSAVEEKGEAARTHFGIIAQDLQAAFEAEGLDAGDYAMFISSTWTDEETGEERTRLGVRYSELLAFIIASI